MASCWPHAALWRSGQRTVPFAPSLRCNFTRGSATPATQALRKSRAFPALDNLAEIDQKRDVYVGPTMESNWVLPGKLLVGAYPASVSDVHHAQLLCAILLKGVSTFACLQHEYRSEGVTREMWQAGDALRPYFQDAVYVLRRLRQKREADPCSVPAVTAPDDAAFVHFPIVDCNVADDSKVRPNALLQWLRALLVWAVHKAPACCLKC